VRREPVALGDGVECLTQRADGGVFYEALEQQEARLPELVQLAGLELRRLRKVRRRLRLAPLVRREQPVARRLLGAYILSRGDDDNNRCCLKDSRPRSSLSSDSFLRLEFIS
jgi:hypothetical protein